MATPAKKTAAKRSTDDTLTVEFEFEKSTKGAHRYTEVTDGDVTIGTLYIRKSAVGDTPQPSLTVTLTFSA